MGQYGSLGDIDAGGRFYRGVSTLLGARRMARWQILRNVTTRPTDVPGSARRLWRGQLVHGRLNNLPTGRFLFIYGPAGESWGFIPSSAARLRLEGFSGLGANTQIDPAVPGIISASGTAAGNIFTGIADVFQASSGEGGGSSEAEASGADAFIDPGAGSSFFESTGGKVVVIGGIALALLATALIVIPKKKSAAAVANRRRNRRRNQKQASLEVVWLPTNRAWVVTWPAGKPVSQRSILKGPAPKAEIQAWLDKRFTSHEYKWRRR